MVHSQKSISTLGRSARRRSSDRERRRDGDGGALGGPHVPALDDDGHATEHPSTFFDHRIVSDFRNRLN